MNQYFVYILECADKSFYTGVCNDIERRMAEHEEGEDSSCYTFFRRPLKLVYNEEYDDINEAIAREKQIKGWSRIKKRALIEEKFDKLVQFSRNYKQYSFTQ